MRAVKMGPQWVKMFATTLSIPMIHMVEEENQHPKWSSDLHMCACSAPQINKWNKTKQIKVLPSPQWTKKVTHKQRGWTLQAYSSRETQACRRRTKRRQDSSMLLKRAAKSRSCNQLYEALTLSPPLSQGMGPQVKQGFTLSKAVVEWERKRTSNEW